MQPTWSVFDTSSFRVWERKNVEYNTPERFRIEIQFSSGKDSNPLVSGQLENNSESLFTRVDTLFEQTFSGAKDGFGSNYTLLREHTKTQQLVFQQHLEHLLSQHGTSSDDKSKLSAVSDTLTILLRAQWSSFALCISMVLILAISLFKARCSRSREEGTRGSGETITDTSSVDPKQDKEGVSAEQDAMERLRRSPTVEKHDRVFAFVGYVTLSFP